MSDSVLPARIAAEDAHHVTTWVLPPIHRHSNILSSAEKEEREAREREEREKSESVDIVEMPDEPEIPVMRITAEEVQAIFDQAQKEGFDQGKADGFHQGHAEGYEAGKQQGFTELREQLEREQARFRRLADALMQPISEQDNDIERYLVDMVTTLTKAVVQRELATDTSHILSLVEQSIAALPVGSPHVNIVVHSDDADVIRNYATASGKEWRVHADDSISAGGCLVSTPDSRVDFTVEKRLQQVLEQFTSKQLAAPDAAVLPSHSVEGAVDEAPPHD